MNYFPNLIQKSRLCERILRGRRRLVPQHWTGCFLLLRRRVWLRSCFGGSQPAEQPPDQTMDWPGQGCQCALLLKQRTSFEGCFCRVATWPYPPRWSMDWLAAQACPAPSSRTSNNLQFRRNKLASSRLLWRLATARRFSILGVFFGFLEKNAIFFFQNRARGGSTPVW